MNIVCIRKCFTLHNQPYNIGDYYTYDYNDFIDGLDIKYYGIYSINRESDNSNILMGYANGRFIDENFVSVYQYVTEMKYVDKMFDFFMDYATQLEKNEKVIVRPGQ